MEASPPAESYDLVRIDRFACCRFELYHVMAITEKNAGDSNGSRSVGRGGTKLLFAALIMHLPVHRTIQSRLW